MLENGMTWFDEFGWSDFGTKLGIFFEVALLKLKILCRAWFYAVIQILFGLLFGLGIFFCFSQKGKIFKKAEKLKIWDFKQMCLIYLQMLIVLRQKLRPFLEEQYFRAVVHGETPSVFCLKKNVPMVSKRLCTEGSLFSKKSKYFVFTYLIKIYLAAHYSRTQFKPMAYNPFVTGNMIKVPAHFIGRIREAEDIIAKIKGNNAVSIIGERRIGKSSLLSYLRHACGVQMPERNTAFLDFSNPELKTLEGFAYSVLGQLRIEFDEEELNKDPNIVLTQKLRQFTIDKPTPIVFLDEFDKIQAFKALFNDEFLANLRFLGNAGHLCLITASKISLKEIIDKGGLDSPLWNIFTQTPLHEFVVEDALDERALFLEQYWCNELTPTDAEKRFLLSYTSAHPLVMQIISFNVCQNRYAAVKRSDAQLREKIEQDMASYFRTPTDKMRQWLYSSRAELPKNIEWTTEFIGKNLKNLNPLKDLKVFG